MMRNEFLIRCTVIGDPKQERRSNYPNTLRSLPLRSLSLLKVKGQVKLFERAEEGRGPLSTLGRALSGYSGEERREASAVRRMFGTPVIGPFSTKWKVSIVYTNLTHWHEV